MMLIRVIHNDNVPIKWLPYLQERHNAYFITLYCVSLKQTLTSYTI